jgi:hypothetical protein
MFVWKWRLALWFITNAAVAIGLPYLFTIWIRREVDYEYATGLRTSTDGDSIVIPIAGFTMLLWFALLVCNAIGLAIYFVAAHRRLRTAA